MKFRFLIISILALLSYSNIFADEWTDENGTVWNYTVTNGYATLIKSSNNPCISGSIPSDLVIPSKIRTYDVTTIGDNAFYNCSEITSVTIPNTVTSIGSSAFYECPNLRSVNIPNSVTSIGESAFYNCESLQVLDIPEGVVSTDWYIRVSALDNASAVRRKINDDNLNVLNYLKVSGTINGYDFMIMRQKTPNLRFLDLTDADVVANDFEYYTGCHSEDNVLGDYAFYLKDNIRIVKLPKNLTRIGNYAFGFSDISDGNLEQVIFPDSLTSIGEGAFCRQGKQLRNIVLPRKLKTIGKYCFQNCWNLQSVVFPERIEVIEEKAFDACYSLGSVTVKTPIPLKITDDVFTTAVQSVLYVPELATSKEKYYWANGWSGFLTHLEYHPEYDHFYIDEDYEVGDGKDQFDGTDGNAPDADIYEGGGFIKEGEDDVQNLDDVNQEIGEDGDGASIIAIDDGENIGNLDINNLHVNFHVAANTWYFFCFPFNVVINQCTYPGDYVWKYYDGLYRAGNGKGWKTVQGDDVNGGVLEAFKGYAFRSSRGGTLTVTFSHPTFGGDRPKTLLEYISENLQNASWNLVGNPYTSYYNFLEEDFNSPITVWNGSSYEAYRPGDDDFHLKPYQAFFVQKPINIDEIEFRHDHCETYQQSQATAAAARKMRLEKGINPKRLIINLEIKKGEVQADRTRVVLNEKASRRYELECDASKFLSTDAAAQLYSLENGVEMAINERPSNGDIALGYTAKEPGTFSISAERMDSPMMLVDLKKNVTFDLTLGAYDFETQAGTFNDRFVLAPSNEATGISVVKKKTGVCIGLQNGGISIGGAEGKEIRIYSTGGVLVARHTGNGHVSLQSGVYVVSIDGESAKVNVR